MQPFDPLPRVRSGQFEGLAAKLGDPAWAPDEGPTTPHPRAGAMAVGVRGPLVRFNVNLDAVEIRFNSLPVPVQETIAVTIGASTVSVDMDLPAGPFVQVFVGGLTVEIASVTVTGDFLFSQQTTDLGVITQIGIADFSATVDFNGEDIGVKNGEGAFIVLAPGTGGSTNGGVAGVISAETWRVSDMEGKLALIEQGLGWGFLPDHLVARGIAEGRLVRLELAKDREALALPVAVGWRADRQPGPAGESIVSFLTENGGKSRP